MTFSSFIPISLRSPVTRLKGKMSIKQISPARQNAVCNFVMSSCIFSLLMHSSVGVNWSRFTLYRSASTTDGGLYQNHQKVAINDITNINSGSEAGRNGKRIIFGIWKYCETDDTGFIIGCDRSSYLLGVPKFKNLLMPDWLILSWVFIFGALVLSIMAVVTAFAAIFTNTIENLFWSLIFHGFVTFFTFSMIILYIFKEIDFQNISEDGGEGLWTFTEHYGKEFYLVSMGGVLSFLHFIRTALSIKNLKKFIVFY